MAQHSDGAIVVSTAIDNSAVGPGTRQFKAQIRDLESSVQRTGRSMADSMGNYVQAMRGAHASARALTGDQKAIQSEISKTEKRIAALAERQELARRKWDASREAAIAKASEEFEKNNTGLELMPWEDEEQAAEQFAEDSIANIQRVIDKFGEFEDTAPFQNSQIEIDMLNERLTQLRAQFAALSDTEDEVADSGEEMGAVLVRTSGGAASALGAAFAKISAGALNALASLSRFAGNSAVTYLKKLATSARNAAIQLAKLSANAIRSGLSRIGALIGGATRSMMGFNREQRTTNGGMGMSLKNLLRYGLGIRSLFALFNRLRTAIKDGFEQMAKSNPELRSSIRSLSTALNGLKASLATAFSPVVTAVAPALSTLIGWLTTAINAIGAFMAALTGQSSYQKAVAGLDSVGGAAGSASGKVQDLKRQLAGFDDLNILSDKNSGGGGGGSSGGGGLTYETEQIGSGIADYVAQLKALWAAADYEGVGRVIGEGINSAFEKAREMISWDSLGAKITQGVNAITGTFNGLVGSINWDLIGRTFGTGVNTLITAANKLLTDINWKNLGVSLATGLNGLVDEVDFAMLGDTIGLRFKAALEAVGSFLTGFDFGNLAAQVSIGFNGILGDVLTAIGDIQWETIGANIGASLNNLITGINWNNLVNVVTEGALGLIKAIRETVSTVRWGNAGTKLSEALNTFFTNKALWSEAGETISSMLEGLLDFSKNFVITFDEIAAGKAIKTALGTIKWKSIATDFWDTVKLAFEKAGNMLKIVLGGDLYNVQGDAVEQMWERGSGDASSASYAETWVHKVAKTVGEIIGGIDWKGIFETAKKAGVDAITGFVDGLFHSENGWFVAKLALAVVALKTVIPTLIGQISTAITTSFVATKIAGKAAVESAASGIGAAGESAFAAAALTIETAALAALDAMLVAYDVKEITEAANGYKEAGKAYETEIGTALGNYKKLYDEKGKEVADAWAENVYGIDTTNSSLAESQQLLVDEITTLWSDAPKSWWEGLKAGFDEYFGENGKGLAGLLGDAGDKILDELGINKSYEENPTIGLKVDPQDMQEYLILTTKVRSALIELDKGRNPYSILQEAYDLGWSPQEIKEAAVALGVSFDTLDKWLKEYEFGNAWSEMLSDQKAELEVSTTFVSSGDPSVKNKEIFPWFKQLFAPGIDTQTRVALLRQGWETVSGWVAGFKGSVQILQAVLLNKTWPSVSEWVLSQKGTARVDQPVGLSKLWASVSDWVNGQRGTTVISQLVGLTKGWTSVSDWVAQNKGAPTVTQFINLAKSGWTTMTAWLGLSATQHALIDLQKDNFKTVSDWLGLGLPLAVMLKLEKGATGHQKASDVYSASDRAVTGKTSLVKGNTGNQTVADCYHGVKEVKGKTSLAKGSSGKQTVSDVYSSKDKLVTALVNLTNKGSNWASGLLKWITGNNQGEVSVKTNLVAGAVTGFAQAVSRIFFGASGGIATANGLRAFAGGGVITGGAVRFLSKVPHYAGGTSRAHGSVFVAGESGPEVIGHINGRTEILNKSQIAQAVYSAVVAGMGQAVNALGSYLADRMAVCTNAIIATLDVRMPAVATGTLMPYEVSAQIARSTADLQNTLDANNEDLIQTIISVAGQIVAAVRASDRTGAAGVTGGPTASQLIDEINRRTLMMGASPLSI